MITTTKKIENECVQMEVIFNKGLVGFEHITKYILCVDKENEVFFWMEATDKSNLSFLLINPFVFFPNYDFKLNDMDIKELDVKGIEDVLVFNTVTISEKVADTTTNLMAPIVINKSTFKGKQIILNDKRYTTKHKIFQQT